MSYFAKKCSNCKNYRGNIRICESCAHYDPPITVFERITASEEVLAEKLVYWTLIEYDGKIHTHWMSTITGEVIYDSEAEAIAATVAKLKEVEK